MFSSEFFFNIVSSNITSFILLSSILLLQIKVALLSHHYNQRIIQLKSKLVYVRTTIQTKRLNSLKIQRSTSTLEKPVNLGTSAVEVVHKTISNLTFDVIETLEGKEAGKTNTHKLRTIHDHSAKGVYRSVRSINNKLSGIVSNFLNPKISKLPKKNDNEPGQ